MRLMDVRGGSTTTNVSITMIKVDRPPVLEPLAELQVVAGSEATADLVVHDPDGNVATLMVSRPSSYRTILGSRFSWSTTMADVGECTLEFTATDQDGVSDSIEWSVVVSSSTVASLFSPLLMDLDARSGYQGLQERSPQELFF